ncbi:hypothetical protein HDG34_005862 [Paraburkholderia sp. HC6.4b]|nr:hypothetical protein [Paraburkholderia sp. HC6.4b]MBB5450208.1 hypothetical protein [Paraburkholderia sp. Kb1A]
MLPGAGRASISQIPDGYQPRISRSISRHVIVVFSYGVKSPTLVNCFVAQPENDAHMMVSSAVSNLIFLSLI